MRAESIYSRLLGESFSELAPIVQRAHIAPLVAEGRMDVHSGDFFGARVLRRMMNLPRAGEDHAVEITVTSEGERMRWRRQIGSTELETTQFLRAGWLVEQSGLGEVRFRLYVRDGNLYYRSDAMTVCRLPLPAAPVIDACVRPGLVGWIVRVEVRWLGQSVCTYEGELVPQ